MGIRWIRSIGRQLLADAGGNILPMAAMSLVIMAGLVGGGVDISRAYKVQNRLQSACDAGALAGRRAVTNKGFDDAAKAQAKRYFGINFDEKQQGTSSTNYQFLADQSANRISGSASTKMPMLLMQLFGIDEMNISVNCATTMGVGNSDITMVLDVTGSMKTALDGGTRLSALQAAMKNFYGTVAAATNGSNARIRYALLPFSSTVNVGRLLNDLNPSYLADTTTIQSRAAAFNTINQVVFSGWDTPVISSSTEYSGTTNSNWVRLNSTTYTNQAACTAALPANTTWANSGTPSTSTTTTTNGSGQQVVTTQTAQPQTMRTYACQGLWTTWFIQYRDSSRTYSTFSYATSDPIYQTTTSQVFDHFDYRPVQYDTSAFKRFQTVSAKVGDNGTALDFTWDGCIEERQTVATDNISFSPTDGVTPKDALDLDIDAAPDGSIASQWKPLWRNIAYLRDSQAASNSGTLAVSYCVPPAQALQEMTQDDFEVYANALRAEGFTYLDVGMLWGARLTNPNGIWADRVNEKPANGGSVNRHIIFMTDGAAETWSLINSAYGIEFLDRRTTSDGSIAQANARQWPRFHAACDAIRARGVRVWVIAFTSDLSQDLLQCASPNSAFTASNSAQLNSAFQEIAKQVGELRVLS